jgi:hypothetical protein
VLFAVSATNDGSFPYVFGCLSLGTHLVDPVCRTTFRVPRLEKICV